MAQLVRPLPMSDPPDGGYGWVCVVAEFFINGFTWGIVAVGITLQNSLRSHPLLADKTPLGLSATGSIFHIISRTMPSQMGRQWIMLSSAASNSQWLLSWPRLQRLLLAYSVPDSPC